MNPDDPRARRTRARLRTAVLELAADRELSSITVSEVAKRAGVNRTTVYQHHPDLHSLVSDSMEEAVAEAVRAAALCPLTAPRDRAPQPLADLFEHIAANATLYHRVLCDRGSPLFAVRMRERLARELAERFREDGRPSGFDDVPVDIHAAYLAGALTGVLAHWLAAQASSPDAPAPGEAALATWRLFRC
ncbi:TetR/AcrR family transcriptional regulator C-terminal domain-containing protein [Streptomyces sp. NPDC059637]|uniref:TetR/AcrR family transcriptional regulator n=1 Tax=Streptomyces sp. NPDC059637 TaxID=3347752 RepID=UPI003698D9EA